MIFVSILHFLQISILTELLPTVSASHAHLILSQRESVPGVPDALLGLLPVTGTLGPLLVDCLLDDGLLVVSVERVTEVVLTQSCHLLKFVTMMGMGSVMPGKSVRNVLFLYSLT